MIASSSIPQRQRRATRPAAHSSRVERAQSRSYTGTLRQRPVPV